MAKCLDVIIKHQTFIAKDNYFISHATHFHKNKYKLSRRRNPPFLFKKYMQLEDKNGRIFN